MIGVLILYTEPSEKEYTAANTMNLPEPESKRDLVHFHFDKGAVTSLFRHPDGSMVVGINGFYNDLVYDSAIYSELELILATK